MATITIHGALGALLALALAGCGGGDFQIDAGVNEARVASAAPAAQAAAPRRGESAAPAAVASAPEGSGGEGALIRRQPQSVEVPDGDVALFGVAVDGSRSVTYQWLRDEQPIEGETGPVLRLRVTSGDHLARISVIVRAGRDTAQSDAAVLRVGRD